MEIKGLVKRGRDINNVLTSFASDILCFIVNFCKKCLEIAKVFFYFAVLEAKKDVVMAEENFLSIKTDLAGINTYLEKHGIKLSEQEDEQLNTIFEACDTYDDENKTSGKDSKLNLVELGEFYNKLKAEMPKFQEYFMVLINSLKNNKIENNIKNSNNTFKTDDMVKNEALKRKKELNENDIKYWSKKIDSVAKKFNIPEALLVSIIGQETNFTKNINSSNGAGPMQVTLISVKDFFPTPKNDWNDIYKEMDEELLNDILYKKDNNGNFVKNNKGEYILQYSTPKELREACSTDDELGIKVGLLCFEMKYVKAVAEKKFGKATFANIPKIIKGIKDGSIKLSAAENKECIKTALKNYNSVFKTYANTLVDSLAMHGFKFEDLYFIK